MLKQVVEDNRELIGSPEGRRALLCEIVRLTVAQNYAALTESGTWRLHMALSATLGSTRSGEARQKIAAALEESQRVSRDSLVAVFGFLAAGAWPADARPGRDDRAHAARRRPAGAERGAAQRAGAGAPRAASDSGEAALVDTLLNAPLPGPGLHGQPAEWTLAAFAYMGVVDAFIELDPDFTPPER